MDKNLSGPVGFRAVISGNGMRTRTRWTNVIVEQADVQRLRARRDGALWPHGRVCANDLVGECR